MTGRGTARVQISNWRNERVVVDQYAIRFLRRNRSQGVKFHLLICDVYDDVPEHVNRSTQNRLEADGIGRVSETVSQTSCVAFACIQFDGVVVGVEHFVSVKVDRP